MTNAVLHGTPVGRRIRLALDVTVHRLRIEVHDARSDRLSVLRAGFDEDESGRGLILVKYPSQRWGCCPRVGAGKIVWVELAPEAQV